ncbi:dTDP-4-dehydrorhamnose 3,5-epimerase [Tianweitania populi]|uniref:dTDP-4-dehydrorhamnose 3,5-epimerase n=1 Tax=Tianweitania populi TaxID=1607949 RepID=A0A8J3GKI3_9HYPH|nr:dTDP-4-dehydrorhamnose 3,5-epimerase [Tianweitania populi]GHD14520.1 dTDP-4-dehydrorhamnose 3,5-epimerase [Tianweitania populi]
MLTVTPLSIADVVELTPRKFGDNRGFFSETFNQQRLIEAGLPGQWIQDNQSLSREKFTLRGLHYQEPPFAQAKLVRVLRGSIFDVAVDIRKGSPTFGKWASLVLSAESFNQILVPEGFAHGFLTLEEDTEVFYKVTAPYSPQHDRNIRWDDPEIAVDWPIEGSAPHLSDKDKVAPLLRDVSLVF